MTALKTIALEQGLKSTFALAALALSGQCLAHYPILDCKLGLEGEAKDSVLCKASFSDRSIAPNVLIEVYSEDDEVIASGNTDAQASYRFTKPEQGAYFIIMDAGPGHVLEISDEEVTEL